jgi:hypothetical protein
VKRKVEKTRTILRPLLCLRLLAIDEPLIFRTLDARGGLPPFFRLTRIIHRYDEIE